MLQEKCELIQKLKVNKFILNNEIKKKTFEEIEPKILVNNITIFYQLASIFHLPKSDILKTFLSISGSLSREEKDFISKLKLDKNFKIKDIYNITYEHLTNKAKININSVSFIYYLTSKLNYTEIAEGSLRYIERCFSMVVETKSFLELDYETVVKILESSQLQVDSEMQIFYAADEWVRHNIAERGKFTADLLVKIRIPLLPVGTLKHIMREDNFVSKNKDCVAYINKILEEKEHH